MYSMAGLKFNGAGDGTEDIVNPMPDPFGVYCEPYSDS